MDNATGHTAITTRTCPSCQREIKLVRYTYWYYYNPRRWIFTLQISMLVIRAYKMKLSGWFLSLLKWGYCICVNLGNIRSPQHLIPVRSCTIWSTSECCWVLVPESREWESLLYSSSASSSECLSLLLTSISRTCVRTRCINRLRWCCISCIPAYFVIHAKGIEAYRLWKSRNTKWWLQRDNRRKRNYCLYRWFQKTICIANYIH